MRRLASVSPVMGEFPFSYRRRHLPPPVPVITLLCLPSPRIANSHFAVGSKHQTHLLYTHPSTNSTPTRYASCPISTTPPRLVYTSLRTRRSQEPKRTCIAGANTSFNRPTASHLGVCGRHCRHIPFRVPVVSIPSHSRSLSGSHG